VVTPLFLAGEDQQDAELRPSAFKGLLRWWYRATKGALTADEGQIFGSTEQTSKWRLRLKEVQVEKDPYSKDDFSEQLGLRYFGFSLDTGTGDARRQRIFIRPRSTFQLEVSCFSSLSLPERRTLLASLWLVLWLGGVGTRCRRGFGSLRVKDIGTLDSDGLSFQFQGQEPAEFFKFLSQNLQIARSWIGPRGVGTNLPEFSVLAPQHSRLYLWKQPYESAQDALDEAGRLLMEYRKRKPRADYDEMKNFLLNPSYTPKALERPAFGLPIQFYFTSVEREKLALLIERALQQKKIVNAKAEARAIAEQRTRSDRITALTKKGFGEREIRGLLTRARNLATAIVSGQGAEEKRHERRASPLLVKVVKPNERQYFLLFLLLKAAILEKGEQLKIEAEGRPPVLVSQPSSFHVIENFLNREVAPNSWEIKL
jgi:CRISPR-associated protein Cmr1